MAPDSIFFVHIPKCGGKSVQHFIAQQVGADRALCDAHLAEHSGRDPNQYRLVSGHLPMSYRQRFQQPPYMLTFLREPVQRSLSMYYFLRTIDPDKHRSLALQNCGKRMGKVLIRAIRLCRQFTICDLIHHEPVIAANLLGNIQTKLLSDQTKASTDSSPSAEDRLEIACANLAHFDFLGLTEQLSTSLAMISRQFNWQLCEAPHLNRGYRTPDSEIDQRTIDALRELTRNDQVLYAHAVEEFERQVHKHRDLICSRPWSWIPSSVRRAFSRRVA